MTLTKLFLIWLGVFCLSLVIGALLRRLAPEVGHVKRSFITSLILVPAIIFGVLPVAEVLAGMMP